MPGARTAWNPPVIVVGMLVLGYLVGSLPTGVLVVRALKGMDIRTVGSGNIGTVNVYRVAGPWASILVLVGDMVKGAAPVLLARMWSQPMTTQVAAGLAAILGHNWSLFLRFGGGKGIATTFGVLLAISPLVGVIAAGIWGLVVALTRYASLGSLLAMLSVPLSMWWRREPVPYLVFGLSVLLLAVVRHRANWARLVSGTELRITDKAGGR